MRKIILFNMMALDGFFEGSNHSIEWHNVDIAFDKFAESQLKSIDTIIFGRKTYELMASYWPTTEAFNNNSDIASLMNSKTKIVFSNSMLKAEWQNTKIVKGNIIEEILKLKQKRGKDIIIFGSADLTSTFREHDLIDEYRIMINPLILGRGTPLFKENDEPLNLKLIKTKTFASGNVLLCYIPKRLSNSI